MDVLYRDLKPENILIDEVGHIKMADFGLAKEGVTGKKTAKSFCGSPAYLAPEMLGTRGVGKAADLYQLGAVLYELLVGFPPYYTENIKKLYENIRGAKLQIPNYLSTPAKNLLKVSTPHILPHPTYRNFSTRILNRESVYRARMNLKQMHSLQILTGNDWRAKNQTHN